MRTRLRPLAALLALLALTTSLAEGARADECTGREGSSSFPVLAQEADSSSNGHAGEHGPSERSGHSDHDREAPASCPMAATSGMACGTAALPVTTISAPLHSEIHLGVATAADEVPGPLALSSPFRPPRR